MIKNYFKIAFRNLKKNKGYSVINIMGLAIGLATCLLITLYVTDELSYDRFWPNAERIYRINTDIKFGGGDLHMTQTSDMMGGLLKKDYPQVQEYARIYNDEGAKLIKKDNEFISEPHVANVDSSFFDVFGFKAVSGNIQTALNAPNTVVITTSAAKKYFGANDALGKNIEVKENETLRPYKVTAVIEDIPENAHIDFDFFFSMQNVDYRWGEISSHNFQTYLLLKPGTDYKTFQKNLDEYVVKHVLPGISSIMDVKSMDELKKSGNKLEYSLMPVTKIHLYSDYSFEIKPPGNIQYVYIFSASALFILILACINFMNLSTARSAKRAKEIGIRKVLGTERKTLIKQFLVESTITATIAMIIALAIAFLVLPSFNNLSAKSLSITDLLSPKVLLVIILMPLLVGLLAGSYPALYLSKFKPKAVLKSNAGGGFKKSSLRSGLVVFQFAISIVLIIATLIVYNQLHFIQNKQLGYNKDQLLIVDGAYALNKNIEPFKNAILGIHGVRRGTISGFLPVANASRNDQTYSKAPVLNAENGLDLQTWRIDYDYIKTMGMEIVKGRNFSKEFGADSSAVLITETTAKLLGFDHPIGKSLYAPSNKNGESYMRPLQIVGVVKDFHYESLKQKIGPLCLRLDKNTSLATFKISAANTNTVIGQIEKAWKSLAPGIPFRYRFLSDSFNEMYVSEQRAGKIAIVFAGLAIFIACLGLFGLATYTAEQRNKEIGIRKVLGASVSNVATMLSKDFLGLVVIACALAFPIAWCMMKKWLQDFEYRVNITWWVFVIAGVAALLITLATVSFQAIKAAIANPVKSLRAE